MKCILCGDPEPLRRWWPQMEKCKQTRRHKCMFTISICSSQCNYSKKRQQLYLALSLGKLCSEHGCSYEWKNSETPRLTQNGKTITCIMYKLCTSRWTRIIIIFQQLGFHIKTKGSVKIFWWIRSINRSNDDSTCQACVRETDANQSWQGSLGKPWFSAHRRRDGRRGCNARHSRLVTALHRKSGGPGDSCAHTSRKERSQLRKVMLQKWSHKNGSTILKLTSLKTEIATYAWEPNYEGSVQKTQ